MFSTRHRTRHVGTVRENYKAKRGGHRGIVTKLLKEAAPLFTEGSEKALNRLKGINRQLQEKAAVLQNLDAEIIELVEVGEIEDEIMEADTIASKIVDMREQIDEFIAKSVSKDEASELPTTTDRVVERSVEPRTAPLRTRTADVSLLGDTDVTSVGMKPKLPKLHINKFSGDVTRFRSFW